MKRTSHAGTMTRGGTLRGYKIPYKRIYWYPEGTEDKDAISKQTIPPQKRLKSCIVMGDGTSQSEEEFFEENDWIDTTEKGAFQEEVNEVYEEFGVKPINFLSTFQPKDPSMRLLWSYATKDGRELVSRTKASVNNFKCKEEYHKDPAKIPVCTICGCKYLMSNVYMYVYEYKAVDKMTVRMKYSNSMEQVSVK